jgi:hypothetical protein
MTILRNSAKCNHCGVEIESTHRHDFVVHYCDVNLGLSPMPWLFAVDGGRAYLKRSGEGFTDTSEFTEQEAT